MTVSGIAGEQPGDKVLYTNTYDIPDALWRVVMYDPANEGNVLLGQEGGQKACGGIFTITGGRTPYGGSGPNSGVMSGTGIDAPAETRLGVHKALCMGPNGTVMAMPNFDATPTPAQIVAFIGRAQEDADDGDFFIIDFML
jgi:hypothetical protein